MKCMRKFLTQWASLLALVFIMHGSFAEQVFIDHCKHGCPIRENGADTLVVRHLFASSMHESGLAERVAYRVFSEAIGVASLLPRTWEAERLVQSANTTASLDSSPRFVQPDLANSQDREYRVNEIRLLADERGRLAPMTSFASTPYLDELNLLSNMSPLPPNLRLGPWARLDQAVNERSAQGGFFYIVSGPLLTPGQSELISEKPAGFFKVIAKDAKLAAFLFPIDSEPHHSYCQYQLGFDDLERLTQINFFPLVSSNWSESLASELGCANLTQ